LLEIEEILVSMLVQGEAMLDKKKNKSDNVVKKEEHPLQTLARLSNLK
jgi:hypothetical protein